MIRIGQQLGSYRVIRPLGEGTFADVYLGEHIYLNTMVAIKILHTWLDESALTTILTEARLVSSLVHPHIIRVFDFGLEDNVPFLVMDYASDGNLRQRHPRGVVVPLATIVPYVKALGSGLQYAHEQGLIHRDLKPENVLVGPQNQILLSDFGLAMLTHCANPLDTKGPFGTLAYMAPELLHGQPCPASDQYALAVMIYEWLCGELPFMGSSDQIVRQHLYTSPPSLRSRKPQIPRAIEQVVSMGLSKEPAQRFENIFSFARAFEEASQKEHLSGGISSQLASSDRQQIPDHKHSPHIAFVHKGGQDSIQHHDEQSGANSHAQMHRKSIVKPFLPPAQEQLTAREIEVLRLLAMGMSDRQIAEHLVLSQNTVHKHNQSIFGKLGVSSRSGATRYALEYQLA